jgi:hypothetical protein
MTRFMPGSFRRTRDPAPVSALDMGLHALGDALAVRVERFPHVAAVSIGAQAWRNPSISEERKIMNRVEAIRAA